MTPTEFRKRSSDKFGDKFLGVTRQMVSSR